ncbi:Lrp/AsnC family transcriptional regulator [Acinetobacter rudis]|uniref:AsnC family transcriptional regulator n=1 Tax=Acinetobacter rudis TaxID=632955 RepID=A0AAW8J569_9GAMM|nr:AsnC family transcriptional regulator [Acinetobacter rudis]MDQ8934498.1 AsnC family transcriptional regulator [Acinetobacter rudis]MDQ8951808.1 AsnC family transcriptional regulator [Acinetobacter rudis]MDQ9016602.1 AsnC family transcriptional regulator [Acinetobacter rudis]
MSTSLDSTDLKILKLLQQDAKMSHKEIGLQVHRTGQAVGQRINRLQELGCIQKYTIEIQHQHTQFVRLLMQNNQFQSFEKFISQQEKLTACYKTSGSACYMIITHFNEIEFKNFIELLSQWGHYSVDSVIKEVHHSP